MRVFNVTDNGQTIPLGRQRENLAQQVVFPVAKFAEKFGDGTPQLWVKRSGDAAPASPAEVVYDAQEQTLTWTVTAHDTEVAGNGQAEIRWVDANTSLLAKSGIYPTHVAASLIGGEEGP